MTRPARRPAGRAGSLPVVLIGAVLLAGCTGSPHSSQSTGTTAPRVTASPAAGTAANAESFCGQATSVFRSLSNAFAAASSSGPAALSSLVDQSVAAFDRIAPPADLANDWVTVRNGFAGLRSSVATMAPRGAGASDEETAALDRLRQTIGPVFERITTYAQAHCPDLMGPTK